VVPIDAELDSSFRDTCHTTLEHIIAGEPSGKKDGRNGATLVFEATLWSAADKLRNNMDAAEDKHICRAWHDSELGGGQG
jgi:hypothetical protein